MASIEKRGNSYRVIFRYGGEKYARSLRTSSERAANAGLARLEDNLRRVELGTLEPPDGVDIATFLLSDGRANGRPAQRRTLRTLSALLDDYLGKIAPGALEDTTLTGMQVHIRRLKSVLGGRARLDSFGLEHLQEYVNRRARDKGRRGRNLSAATIKKELRTLKTAWTWAMDSGALNRPLPSKGLRYPKTTEKPPFQTREEIERKIARGGLTEAEEADLWDCLFLTLPEIDQVLGLVKNRARQPFLYPMFVFAAHTGARRSEMIRSHIDDIDFDGQTAIIREKKRVRGELSTRRVPLSPLLLTVMRDWLANHHGGNQTFCLEPTIARSTKTRQIGASLTRDEAHDHFKRTLADTDWDKLRGWHVFRHSFYSNCAAAGVDQRVINAWVGHQTEEMVRRYRHLIPGQQRQEIQRVFATEPIRRHG